MEVKMHPVHMGCFLYATYYFLSKKGDMKMDFTILTENFVLVVLVACLIMGYAIKNTSIFKFIPNSDIPSILAVFGAVLNAVVSGISVESVVF